jgi:hypothetical protein
LPAAIITLFLAKFNQYKCTLSFHAAQCSLIIIIFCIEQSLLFIFVLLLHKEENLKESITIRKSAAIWVVQNGTPGYVSANGRMLLEKMAKLCKKGGTKAPQVDGTWSAHKGGHRT